MFGFWYACKKYFPLGHKMVTVRMMTFDEHKLVMCYECTWDKRKKNHPDVLLTLKTLSFDERL